MRLEPPAAGEMSYFNSAWSAVARSIVCVKTRKGGRRARGWTAALADFELCDREG